MYEAFWFFVQNFIFCGAGCSFWYLFSHFLNYKGIRKKKRKQKDKSTNYGRNKKNEKRKKYKNKDK